MAKITMLLANGPGKPEGDIADRIDLRVPLTMQGQVDEQAYGADDEPWPFRRTLPDGRSIDGDVVRLESGWALRSARHEEAPLWALETKVVRPGEYAWLRAPDGQELVFRIVNVEPEP